MGTIESVLVVCIALLPGGLYVWGFERQVGRWGIGLPDRVLRFFGVSSFAHVLAAPMTYWVWANAGDAANGYARWWVWAALAGYVAVPFGTGSLVGRATREGRPWTLALTGPHPAPRARDHFFASRPTGWLRLRLKSGRWVGGVFVPFGTPLSSYAAGYPEAQDLFLTETVVVDGETGEFILDDGAPIVRGTSLLIRWCEVEFLEFTDMRRGSTDVPAPKA